MNKQQLIKELETTPDFLIPEVYHFLLFLKTKIKTQPLPNPPPTNDNPILNMINKITAEIPLEKWDQLPEDLIQNLNHYLYVSPNKNSTACLVNMCNIFLWLHSINPGS